MRCADIHIVFGQEVMSLLYDDKFIEQWDNLYLQCPWGTVFQSSKFVKVWYENYNTEHLPILVFSKADGVLTGILPLAEATNKSTITGAGCYDAFYHTWLTFPENEDKFITSAIEALLSFFPNREVYLKYIPPHTPCDWIRKCHKWDKLCVTRAFRRPFMDLHVPNIEEKFNSKHFRMKHKKLRRIGTCHLELIENFNYFTSILDIVADQYDFRKAATYNIMPFRDKRTKKAFFLSLFKEGLLNAAVLKVNEDIVGADFSISGKNGWVHSTIIVYDPAYSIYSPGYLTKRMLGMYFMQSGRSAIDLAPGGHKYKECHTNSHDYVYELRITNQVKALCLKSLFTSAALIKDQLPKIGIDPKKMKLSLFNKVDLLQDFIKNFRIGTLAQNVNNYSESINKCLLKFSASGNSNIEIKKNSLKDLLAFSTSGSTMSKWEFMKRAMKYFEIGLIPYTYCENNRLIFLIWQVSSNVKMDWHDSLKLPAKSHLFMNLYLDSDAEDRLVDFLSAVAAKVTSKNKDNSIYIINSISPKYQKFSSQIETYALT